MPCQGAVRGVQLKFNVLKIPPLRELGQKNIHILPGRRGDFRLIPTMTVYENVAFAMRVTNINNKTIKNRVPFALSLVGLEDKMDRLPDELSGGEQQRA